MSDGAFHADDVHLERRVVTHPGRRWAEIGISLVAAFALSGLAAIGIWAVVVLAGALG